MKVPPLLKEEEAAGDDIVVEEETDATEEEDRSGAGAGLALNIEGVKVGGTAVTTGL